MKRYGLLIALLSLFSLHTFAQQDPGLDKEELIHASIQAPQPVNLEAVRSAINYPSLARDLGVEGKLLVRVLVDAEGNYLKHNVIGQQDKNLVEAIVPHLAKLEFEPAVKSGKNIPVWTTLAFNFELTDD